MGDSARRSHWLRSILGIGSLALLGAAIMASFAVYRFGSVGNALLFVRGDRVLIRSRVHTLGTVPVGEKRFIRYELTNLTGRPVNVVGHQAPCSCTTVLKLPAVLPHARAETIELEYCPTPEQAGSSYTGELKVFLDDTYVRQLDMRFTAKVTVVPSTYLTRLD